MCLVVMQAKVLWVVNAVEKDWEKQLPDEVQGPLNASRKKKGGLYASEETKSDAEPDDAKGGYLQLARLPAGQVVASPVDRQSMKNLLCSAGTAAIQSSQPAVCGFPGVSKTRQVVCFVRFSRMEPCSLGLRLLMKHGAPLFPGHIKLGRYMHDSLLPPMTGCTAALSCRLGHG